MFAYIKNGTVVAIYSTDTHKMEGCDRIPLIDPANIPQLGWKYEGGKFVEPVRGIIEADVTELIEAALKVIDSEAVAVRKSHIGELSDQLGIYTAKYQDAKAYKLKVFGEEVAQYKWLSAEASATGEALDVVADKFVGLYQTMLDALTKCEELRIYGKSQIRNAKDPKEIREVKMQTISEMRTLLRK